ncbi:hypothetical protein [Brevundimonas sp. CEF1]|uniref:hypothetical protein n=1 Tax=Brevundimonas sp. CEF1 TaxID=3442642 RepID=UPI003F51896C
MTENTVRNTLYFTAAYNLMGFFTFLMPARFGALAGLPTDVPMLYTGFIAANILLFGFVGLWQARASSLNLGVLTIFGISKITFSALMFLSWRQEEILLTGFLMSLVDLAMGVVFLAGARRLSLSAQRAFWR